MFPLYPVLIPYSFGPRFLENVSEGGRRSYVSGSESRVTPSFRESISSLVLCFAVLVSYRAATVLYLPISLARPTDRNGPLLRGWDGGQIPFYIGHSAVGQVHPPGVFGSEDFAESASIVLKRLLFIICATRCPLLMSLPRPIVSYLKNRPFSGGPSRSFRLPPNADQHYEWP